MTLQVSTEHGRECMNGTTGGYIEQQIWGARCQSINLKKRGVAVWRQE
jgi:hypothetical protein